MSSTRRSIKKLNDQDKRHISNLMCLGFASNYMKDLVAEKKQIPRSGGLLASMVPIFRKYMGKKRVSKFHKDRYSLISLRLNSVRNRKNKT